MENTKYPKSLLLLFEVKFWYLLGINPNFSTCVNCGEDLDNGYLLVNSGGLICPKCSLNFECDLNIEESKIVKNNVFKQLKLNCCKLGVDFRGIEVLILIFGILHLLF